VSGEIEGGRYDLHAVTDAEAADRSGVPHGRELLALAEAVVRGGDRELERAREASRAALGPEAFVEAAAVVANFERMVRIADATGIPLDAPVDAMTASLRAELGIDRFGSAANTPAVALGRRALGRALSPLARYLMPALAALSRRAAARHGAAAARHGVAAPPPGAPRP
jgi:hypothetical protein